MTLTFWQIFINVWSIILLSYLRVLWRQDLYCHFLLNTYYWMQFIFVCACCVCGNSYGYVLRCYLIHYWPFILMLFLSLCMPKSNGPWIISFLGRCKCGWIQVYHLGERVYQSSYRSRRKFLDCEILPYGMVMVHLFITTDPSYTLEQFIEMPQLTADDVPWLVPSLPW